MTRVDTSHVLTELGKGPPPPLPSQLGLPFGKPSEFPEDGAEK
jgi:hypothetical protein